MKRLLNPVMGIIVRSKPGWYFTKLLIRFAEWLRFERSKYEHILSEQRLQKYFAEPVVRSGYFAGLKYTGFVSIGSALFPKLSGTYESELIAVFKNFEKTDYKQIIDVGCAEGYYAVGLALKYSNALVYAFDIDTKAQEICNEMAQANGVSGRVTVAGECTSAWIENTDASVRKLLICDCEGFERYLFISSTIPALVNCDLIIELHPMHQPDVKEYLEALFKETHTVKFVTSYDDRRKMFDLDSSYAEMTLLDRARLVQEGRPFSMEWMILSSKNKA